MNNSSQMSSKDNNSVLFDQQQKSLPADFYLTSDQYLMLQYNLPKRYALLQLKPTIGKRGPIAHIHKNINSILSQQKQNISKMSGNMQNSQFDKSKRSRIKKLDRYLDQEPIKQQPKRSVTEKVQLDDQMLQCLSLLNNLKKHRSSGPFLLPVDPKFDGAYNYLQIIKQPMDLSTIQKNLKSGEYQTSGQFHGDICKIWHNSYAYNEKTSPIYKMTIQMQKYYKNLLTNDSILNKTAVVKMDKSKIKQRKINQKQKQKQKNKIDQKKKKKILLQSNKNTTNSSNNNNEIIKDNMDIEEKQQVEKQQMDVQDKQENEEDRDYDGYDQ